MFAAIQDLLTMADSAEALLATLRAHGEADAAYAIRRRIRSFRTACLTSR